MSIPVQVLDSRVLLAWLREEYAAVRVRALFEAADAGSIRLLMSWINVGDASCKGFAPV